MRVNRVCPIVLVLLWLLAPAMLHQPYIVFYGVAFAIAWPMLAYMGFRVGWVLGALIFASTFLGLWHSTSLGGLVRVVVMLQSGVVIGWVYWNKQRIGDENRGGAGAGGAS